MFPHISHPCPSFSQSFCLFINDCLSESPTWPSIQSSFSLIMNSKLVFPSVWLSPHSLVTLSLWKKFQSNIVTASCNRQYDCTIEYSSFLHFSLISTSLSIPCSLNRVFLLHFLFLSSATGSQCERLRLCQAAPWPAE